MLRTAIVALLLGTLATIAGLVLIFAPSIESGRQIPAIKWQPVEARVAQGFATHKDNVLQLELDSAGHGTVRLANLKLKATDYPYLHIAIDESSTELHAVLVWLNSDAPGEPHSLVLQSEPRDSLWLATAELKGWSGNISALQLFFFGSAGELVGIRDFAPYAASPARQLKAIYSDLRGYESWNRAAMNTHSGVNPVASFYPIPMAVSLLCLSALAYGLLLLLFRARLKFNWRVVALLFLTCWISLDLVWQNQLLHQVADTHRRFSGKDTAGKNSVGPDATLFQFITQVKPLLQPRDARVFVSSLDEYQGLRAAYFLYPFNVYWSEPTQKFPSDRLQKGDYLVLIPPTTLNFVRMGKLLYLSPKVHVRVDLVFQDATGTVVQMK